MNEFVLFTNLSEEDAKYLVNSMNYILGLMNQVS